MVGFTNTMSYGKLTLNFSFDACIGGKMLSQYNRYMWAGGRSLDIDDQARKDWYAGKDYLAQGVNVISGTLERDGDGNVISDTRQFAPNTKTTNYFDYIQNSKGYSDKGWQAEKKKIPATIVINLLFVIFIISNFTLIQLLERQVHIKSHITE